MEGHSTLSTKGADILCAAVSVLSENLGYSLEELLKKNPQVEKQEGYYRLELQSDQRDRDSDLLIASTALGLRILAEQYPERVKLFE